MRTISLDGAWKYVPESKTILKADRSLERITDELPEPGVMEIPCNWHRGGLENFNGEVEFERRFEFNLSSLKEDESVWLCFDGVDYFCEATLNDDLVGRHEGYFQPFSLEVTPLLRDGENVLTVLVNSPFEDAPSVWPSNKLLIKGILSHWDAKPGGWDPEWGQDGNTGGIWNSVRLEIRPPVYVKDVFVTTRLLPKEIGEEGISGILGGESLTEALVPRVTVRWTITSARAENFTLRVVVGTAKREEEVALVSGENKSEWVFSLPDAELWWPRDLGEATLTECRVEVLRNGETLHSWHDEIGLREVRIDPETGQWYINGKRFFVRGTNVVPALWLGEYSDERIAKDIKMLKEANINGVRVCVHVTREEFYRACDRAGIVVWQDFPLQWGYTTDDRFTAEACRQIKDMVQLLRNRASVCMWVCQNESTSHNTHVLDPLLADAVAEEDSSRYVRPTSLMSEHTYPGWYMGEARDYVATEAGPFLSEFGAQALPSVEEMKEMVGEGWPPDFQKLAYHNFQYDQTFNVAGVEMGSSWEEFVTNSQKYQADLLKLAIERYRLVKYQKIGCMFQFMFMDAWPAVTWSIVSYDRVPKKAYFAVKKAYQPILAGADVGAKRVSSKISRGTLPNLLFIRPWVVNDRHEDFDDLTLEIRLIRERLDSLVYSNLVSVPADSVEKYQPTAIPIAGKPPADYSLVVRLTHKGKILSENDYPLEIT